MVEPENVALIGHRPPELADLDADHPHARQHAGRIVDVLQAAFAGSR
jgi:hypothetical protein